MKNNQDKRAARRIIHEEHGVLSAAPREALPYIARAFGKAFNLPQKTMLKAMARYRRIHLGG